MSRRKWIVAGVLAVAVIGLALMFWYFSVSELDPDRAERVTLYSIDFREGPARLPGTGEVIHGYPVLDKVEAMDIEQRRQLLNALKAAIAERGVTQYKCFWPRHVLRVEQGGRTIDYVICFHCGNYMRYVGEDTKNYKTPSIGRNAAPVFNKLLEDAGVPIVPDMK